MNGQDEKTWALCCHVAAFAIFVGIPFGNIVGPLVVWLIKREESDFVDYHGKEALNFQISMTIYAFIAAVLSLGCIGILLLPAVLIVGIIFTVIATVRSSQGEYYQYPITIRFID